MATYPAVGSGRNFLAIETKAVGLNLIKAKKSRWRNSPLRFEMKLKKSTP